MTLNTSPGAGAPQKRRRGASLESAILQAAWELLLEGGYSGFTYEAVAARARTSRPVLYRRWPKRSDLLLAAMAYGGSTVERVVPDTGSLREDAIAFLTELNNNRTQILALLVSQLGAFYSETDTTPAEVREAFVGDRTTPMVEILERAVARGEADPRRITERIVTAPADLVRQRVMMSLKAMPRVEIEEIVDQILLPLVVPLETGEP